MPSFPTAAFSPGTSGHLMVIPERILSSQLGVENSRNCEKINVAPDASDRRIGTIA